MLVDAAIALNLAMFNSRSDLLTDGGCAKTQGNRPPKVESSGLQLRS